MRRAACLTKRSMLAALVIVAALCALGAGAVGCESSATAATQDATLAPVDSVQVTPEAASEALVTSSEGSATSPGDAASSSENLATRKLSAAGDEGLFDSSLVHEIVVTFAQEDYDAVIQTYQESGEKDWIEATVTIDGETYERVGVRLKGNSSIMGLRQGGVGPAGGDGRVGGMGRVNGPGGNVSTDSPEGLPWLIDLDKYVDNQNHEGVVELAVRSNSSQTALNEAVSLGLLEEAGLASQEAVYVSFSVNGSEPRLRLVIENPDDMWMADNFDISGALYKAESTGDYSYRGENPDSYDEVFDQEAGKTNADLTPLIEFLDFINNSDDATFKAELPDRLDIDAFATYLAMQELISNNDDIDGPGNNSYLYYDAKTETFTVVAWDHNLAFGGMGGAMGGAGGVRPGGGATLPGAGAGDFDGSLPDETQRPEGAQAQGRIGGGEGIRGKSNILVERFMADAEWKQLYEDQLAELRTELYASGKAADILAEWVTVLERQASDLIDAATVQQEAANISRYFATD